MVPLRPDPAGGPGKRNVCLIFETTGSGGCRLSGRGASCGTPPSVSRRRRPTRARLRSPLPAGGGEATDHGSAAPVGTRPWCRPFSGSPPTPQIRPGTIAYANYYGLSAGASALAAVLLWGLFLLGLAHGKRNWALLLPTLAAALLTVHRLAVGYGAYFLPPALQGPLSSPWLEGLTALALAALSAPPPGAGLLEGPGAGRRLERRGAGPGGAGFPPAGRVCWPDI